MVDAKQHPKTMEPLGAVVERLAMSVEGVTAGDRGYKTTCVVNTRDLMILVGAVMQVGPALLNKQFGVTRTRDGKTEDLS